MANEATKEQIREWLEAAIEKQRNPDPRERVKRMRQQRAQKVAQKYGL